MHIWNTEQVDFTEQNYEGHNMACDSSYFPNQEQIKRVSTKIILDIFSLRKMINFKLKRI